MISIESTISTGWKREPVVSRLYTRAGLRHAFCAWEILELDEYDTKLHEGAAHNGLSALVDLVARKPVDGSG